MQTGSSETLIGWKSGKTTQVPLWGRMEGAWLWTQDFDERDKYKPVFPRLSLAGKLENHLKVLKIENFFDCDFAICVIFLLVMSKYLDFTKKVF